MTQSPQSHAGDYRPDPFALQITSLIIHRRAEFLAHSGCVFADLIELSADYDKYGKLLAELSGVPTPFDPNAKEVPTPVELFLETDEFVGYTQRVPRPSVGMEIRHFRLASRSEAGHTRLGPSPQMARSLAVIDLIQHPGLQWEVMHAEVGQQHRRQGIATMLYDRIEDVLQTTLRASGWLSLDAYRFWQQRDPSVVQWHLEVESLPGLWITPKQLLNLKAIAELKLMEGANEGQPAQ